MVSQNVIYEPVLSKGIVNYWRDSPLFQKYFSYLPATACLTTWLLREFSQLFAYSAEKIIHGGYQPVVRN